MCERRVAKYKDKSSYIDGTYTIFNKLVEIHKDPSQYRESHYIKSYKMAKILYNNFKKTKKDYFFTIVSKISLTFN